MSQFPQLIIDEPVNAGMGTPDAAAKKPAAGGYRLLAVIAFICAVGGLFLGLLSAVTGIFQPNFNGNLSTFEAENVPLADSLFGYVYAYFATIVSRGAGTFFSDMFRQGYTANVLEFGLLVLLCVTVVLSVVLMIVALCSRKAAKNCAMTSAILVFLTYAGYFLLSYYLLAVERGDFSGAMVDLSTGAVAGVMLIALIVTALVRRKGKGVLNLVSFLLLAATVFGLTYPGSATVAADIWYTHIGENLFVNLTAFITMAVIILNLILSTVRLSAHRAYVFDAVRLGVLFAAVLLAVIAQITDKSADVMFNSDNLLPVILALAASLAAFLLALIAAISQTSGARARSDEAASAEAGEHYALAQPGDAAPSAQPAAAAQPVAAAQPATAAQTQQTIPGTGTTVIVQQPAAQQPAPPIYAVPFFAAPMTPSAVPAAPASAAPAPAPEPTSAAEDKKPSAKAAAADDSPMSEFERSMAALARGIAPEETPQQAAGAPYAYHYAPAAAQPVQSAPPAPAYVAPPAAAYAPAYAQQAAPRAVYDPTPYTYDPFINTLTPQEKNEFGDLFIANRFGDLAYLPAYVIGGDNREFFRRVFIYLGKFRSHISPELLGKLYQYVSKL